jgi:hypothetical protein
MPKTPTCKRCGNDHFNFVPCAVSETFSADQADKARRLQNLAQPVLRPRSNDWNNRYTRHGYQEIADGVVVLKRPPIHSVTRPDFKQGEK